MCLKCKLIIWEKKGKYRRREKNDKYKIVKNIAHSKY